MENNVIDLSELNAAIGLGDSDDSYGAAISTNVQDKDIKQLKNIIGNTTPSGVNTSRVTDEVDPNARPDYMKEYEDVLSRKFEKLEDDQTNYTKKAIETFGADYASISNRDQFEEELKYRDSLQNHINSDPHINILQNIIDGSETERSLIENVMSHKLDKDDPDYEDQLKRRMDQFFDENGAINQRGKAKYAEIIGTYKGALNSKLQDARKLAQDSVVQHREFKSTLANELKSYKPAGVELSEDLASHLNNFITSGKLQAWLDKAPENTQEAARKKIALALVADPQAFANWIDGVDKRGQNYGAQNKARTFFKNN